MEETLANMMVTKIEERYIPLLYSMFLSYRDGSRNKNFEEAFINKMMQDYPAIVEAFEACRKAGLGYPE